MSKIEQESKDSKEKILSDIMNNAKSGVFDETVSLVRGCLYSTENQHILGISSSIEASISLKAFIDACKNHKDSRHPVDYIVASFVGNIAIEQCDGLGKMSKEARDKAINESIRTLNEKEREKTLMIFVLSEGEVELTAYGVIESTSRNKTSVVISPEPIYSKKGKSTGESALGTVGLKNFFEMSESERSTFEETGLSYDGVFDLDTKVFKENKEFNKLKVKSKKKKKKKTKFGY